MKCKIISGPYDKNLMSYLEIEEDDFVIGADIGAYMLSEHSISFDLANEVFAIFIVRSDFSVVYGAFAAVPIFLIWIYILCPKLTIRDDLSQ